jgi:hypothetical protein
MKTLLMDESYKNEQNHRETWSIKGNPKNMTTNDKFNLNAW